ncbi:MAG TPA: hypothetical protein VGS15_06050 [Candidatus Acidoferrales bacterium]|nr:hypothetical protein [Candidatus Acidoferrales bacterium]
MIENTATYDFLIENENQSLEHSFQRKIRTAKIHGGAGSDVEEDLDPLDARERKRIFPILRAPPFEFSAASADGGGASDFFSERRAFCIVVANAGGEKIHEAECGPEE